MPILFAATVWHEPRVDWSANVCSRFHFGQSIFSTGNSWSPADLRYTRPDKIYAATTEMKFHFRRASNWIFGFRWRISDDWPGTKKKKKKREQSGILSASASGRITLQFLFPAVDFSLSARYIDDSAVSPSLINLRNKERPRDDSSL